MKYLCLGYYDPAAFDATTEAEREAIARECRPHDEALHASGRLLAVASLEHRTAVTLRPGKGGTTVTDGPFTETKELIGSFFIIEADSLEEAIRVASLHPAARWGEHLGFAVEVRPIEFVIEPSRDAREGTLEQVDGRGRLRFVRALPLDGSTG